MKRRKRRNKGPVVGGVVTPRPSHEPITDLTAALTKGAVCPPTKEKKPDEKQVAG